jgi:beta-1,4-mannosyltransferase
VAATTAAAVAAAAAAGPQRTLFTERLADGRIVRRADRPALLVSSTSWTEDEDFGVLLDALVRLDAAAAGGIAGAARAGADGAAAAGVGAGAGRRGAQGGALSSSAAAALPRFVVVVTGKGPQRAMYEARMAALALRRVRVCTAWLEAADYPLLLGSADLGVCLHTSSSGLDLPMKVVDMFGAGLPVCAVGFACLGELVRHGENGLVFADARELAEQVARLFAGFGGGGAGGAGGGAPGVELARLREGVRAFQRVRWHDNWLTNAAPIFLGEGGAAGAI